jgi:hypothetical protein
VTAPLYALNGGWPFGDGPLQWFCRTEIREGARARELHMICGQCPQSVFCLAPDVDKTGFTWNLELLKSRIADHVLKCHAEAAAS